MKQSNQRNCPYCGKSFIGRTDKKYCDDYCRSSFNNTQKSSRLELVRNINKKLLRNRNILERLLSENPRQSKASEKDLYSKGFDFEYFTNTQRLKSGETCYYCYEYGYYIRNGFVKLLKKH